jgi:hypothetical protein
MTLIKSIRARKYNLKNGLEHLLTELPYFTKDLEGFESLRPAKKN